MTEQQPELFDDKDYALAPRWSSRALKMPDEVLTDQALCTRLLRVQEDLNSEDLNLRLNAEHKLKRARQGWPDLFDANGRVKTS